MAVDLLTPPGQGDSGEADPGLRAALEAGDPRALAEALAGARVFVGIESRLVELADVAAPPSACHPGHTPPGKPGLRAEKTSEMMLATLRLPSGATALPVFSSVAALTAWRASARPVPVAAPDACAEAARLGHPTVVVDVAGPVTATVDVSALTAAPATARPEAGVSGLHPPRAPWDAACRDRVGAALDTLVADGLARRARLWQARLVDASGEATDVVAVAAAADEARLGEIARRLRAAAAGPAGDGPAVVLVGPDEGGALRRRLGKGMSARRFGRRVASA